MKDWGTVHSTKQPEPLAIDDFSVWVANNIKEVDLPGGETATGYEYGLVQYDKDEYIRLMDDSLASTQEAVDFLLMNT